MRFDAQLLGKCWFLVGPTACGKSVISLPLARRLGAEIVSLDSMSLYSGMDIGTAKPSLADRQELPHHLIDVIEPHEVFSLAEYVDEALRVCQCICDRGRLPLFVGGTGLYLRGVLRGVFDGPPADWDFRQALEAEAAKNSPDWLHARLKRVDPESAARLHPHDLRRIVRALEVHAVTGRPLSEQQRQEPLPVEKRPRHVYWLSPPRDWLHQRINRRVEAMVAGGLFDEVRRLLNGPQPLGRTARQALGYKEVIDALEAGANLRETIPVIQTRTRQFAKRQETWFRNLEECTPIPVTGTESNDELVDRLIARRETDA